MNDEHPNRSLTAARRNDLSDYSVPILLKVCRRHTRFVVQEVLLYFVYKLIGRWWKAHRSLLSEAGFKLPQAAGIKSAGGER